MDVTERKLFEVFVDYDCSNFMQTQMIEQIMKELFIETLNSLRIYSYHWALTCNIFVMFASFKDQNLTKRLC